MTVLKGGAATALYGLRASNGVILITTKKGSNNTKMKIDFILRLLLIRYHRHRNGKMHMHRVLPKDM